VHERHRLHPRDSALPARPDNASRASRTRSARSSACRVVTRCSNAACNEASTRTAITLARHANRRPMNASLLARATKTAPEAHRSAVSLVGSASPASTTKTAQQSGRCKCSGPAIRPSASARNACRTFSVRATESAIEHQIAAWTVCRASIAPETRFVIRTGTRARAPSTRARAARQTPRTSSTRLRAADLRPPFTATEATEG
jgi:hypothetical protein